MQQEKKREMPPQGGPTFTPIESYGLDTPTWWEHRVTALSILLPLRKLPLYSVQHADHH